MNDNACLGPLHEVGWHRVPVLCWFVGLLRSFAGPGLMFQLYDTDKIGGAEPHVGHRVRAQSLIQPPIIRRA